MIRRAPALLACLALIGAGLGAPARAESVRGKPSTELAREAMHNFAACVASTTPEGARKLLALDPATPEYGEMMRRLAKGSDRCMAGRMKFSGELFAGGLAEALLAHDRRIAALDGWVAGNPAAASLAGHGPIEALGICIVRAAPKQVSAVFTTTPASDAENAALQGIVAPMMKCVPEGQELHVNGAGLRAAMAVGAYRLAAYKAGEISA